MRNVNYDFSSVHINLPKDLSEDIINWGREKISDNDIFVRQNTFGREDEIHTTILYGIHSRKSLDVRRILEFEKPLLVKLKKVEIFINNPKFDVVVIDVVSEDLNRLHKNLSDNIAHTNRYGKYQPHVTIAYVQKDLGWKHRGDNKWDDQAFTVDHVVFSSKNGTKEDIFLSN